MKMNQLAKICYFLSVIGILGMLCACGGGGGGGGGGDDPNPATYNATGTWTSTTTNHWIDQGNSGDCTGGSNETQTVTINQTGNSFTIVIKGETWSGTVSGATYTGSRSYPEEGGTTTESINVTLTSATSGSGTGAWDWSDGTWYCNGGYNISLTKTSNGGGDDDDVTGSGTLTDPYILSAGVTYPAYVQGFQALCGMTFNFTCADFDDDYVTAKFTAPSSGTYRVSFTGIPSDRDLVVYFYRSDSPGSSIVEYIDTLDNAGNGGDEVAEAPVEAGIDYYMFLQMWGGEADFSARIDKL